MVTYADGFGGFGGATTRALARFQSFPDTYILSGNNRLDAKGIGNAVCPLMMQRIFQSLLEATS